MGSVMYTNPTTGYVFDPTTMYDARYWAEQISPPYGHCEPWIGHNRRLAQHIVDVFAPRSVFDAGCGWGLLIAALRDLNVGARGIDISEYALSRVRADVRPHCWQGSVADYPTGFVKYDLIVSIEVLEHVPECLAKFAVGRMCNATSDVLFSASHSNTDEPTHVNIHPPEYWVDVFAGRGFCRMEYDGRYISNRAMHFRGSR